MPCPLSPRHFGSPIRRKTPRSLLGFPCGAQPGPLSVTAKRRGDIGPARGRRDSVPAPTAAAAQPLWPPRGPPVRGAEFNSRSGRLLFPQRQVKPRTPPDSASFTLSGRPFSLTKLVRVVCASRGLHTASRVCGPLSFLRVDRVSSAEARSRCRVHALSSAFQALCGQKRRPRSHALATPGFRNLTTAAASVLAFIWAQDASIACHSLALVEENWGIQLDGDVALGILVSKPSSLWPSPAIAPSSLSTLSYRSIVRLAIRASQQRSGKTGDSGAKIRVDRTYAYSGSRLVRLRAAGRHDLGSR
ncbi:hypothetical protein HWV62_2533 [Athelia sp. TMB]|nr:hypothetical protein HWV62_2533 [Athelia sp. TMB]